MKEISLGFVIASSSTMDKGFVVHFLIGLINPNRVNDRRSENARIINLQVYSLRLCKPLKYVIPVSAISKKTTENFVIVTAVE